MDELIYISIGIFTFGLSILFSPLVKKAMTRMELVDGDARAFVWLLYLGILFAASAGLVVMAQDNPLVLTPLVLITAVLRILAPGALVRGLHGDKLHMLGVFSGFMAAIGVYTVFRGGEGFLISYNLIMALSVGILFSRYYVGALVGKSGERDPLPLFAGLFLGLSFIVLLPYLYPDFNMWYKVSGIFGWGIASAMSFSKGNE